MMGYGRGYYGYNNMMGGGGFGGLIVLLFGVVMIAGIVLLVMWAVRGSHGHGSAMTAGPPPPHPGEAGHHEAVAIAKKRLANGEITKEQYEEIVRALST